MADTGFFLVGKPSKCELKLSWNIEKVCPEIPTRASTIPESNIKV